jgi:hypothetical protein
VVKRRGFKILWLRYIEPINILNPHNILNPLLLNMETNKSLSENHIIPNPHPENYFWGFDIPQP